MQENKRNKESVGLKWERLPSEEEEAVDSIERDTEDTDVLKTQNCSSSIETMSQHNTIVPEAPP